MHCTCFFPSLKLRGFRPFCSVVSNAVPFERNPLVIQFNVYQLNNFRFSESIINFKEDSNTPVIYYDIIIRCGERATAFLQLNVFDTELSFKNFGCSFCSLFYFNLIRNSTCKYGSEKKYVCRIIWSKEKSSAIIRIQVDSRDLLTICICC